MLSITALTKEDVDRCPIRQILSKLTGKWQMLIVLALEDEALRFGALRRTLGDITQRVLTENLRSMERHGILSRSVDPGPPVAVSYALTDLGREWLDHVRRMALWAADRHGEIAATCAKHDAAG